MSFPQCRSNKRPALSTHKHACTHTHTPLESSFTAKPLAISWSRGLLAGNASKHLLLEAHESKSECLLHLQYERGCVGVFVSVCVRGTQLQYFSVLDLL